MPKTTKEVQEMFDKATDSINKTTEKLEEFVKTIDKFTETWETVKQFYSEKFNIDPELVDLNSNYTILIMCASGASNESISHFLNIPLHNIELVLNEVFGFTGWTKDLPVNPYKVYKDSFGDKDRCNNVFWEQARALALDDVFEMCKVMERIDKRLEDEWV